MTPAIPRRRKSSDIKRQPGTALRGNMIFADEDFELG
jgi:hypothetical protein